VPEKRREVRYPARIVARISRRNQVVELLTNDVSFRGVFVRTDTPPALRQLVKLELLLPQDKIVVSGHAMVVHVFERDAKKAKGEGPVPGIGLQFWGSIEHAKEWEKFIHELKQRQRTGNAAAKVTDKVRRISERFKLTIEVVFDGDTAMTRDVSLMGMAIRTTMAMPVGARTELSMRAGNKTLTFDAVVRRAIDEPGFRGLGVELVDMTEAQRQELLTFIKTNSPPSEDKIFVSPGDPELH
jgi:hypothetical protein